MSRTYRVILEVDVEVESDELDDDNWEAVEESLEDSFSWAAIHDLIVGPGFVNHVRVDTFVEDR